MTIFHSIRSKNTKNCDRGQRSKQLGIEGLEVRRLMCSEGALCPSGPTEDADISLRDLVARANEYSNHDVIELQAYTTYYLGKSCSGEDFDYCGDLDIREDLTIRANGPEVTIDARRGPNMPAVDRVMEVISAALTLDGVTVTGGLVNGAGGGIYNDEGTVNLNGGSSVEDNTAVRGGGISNSGTVNLNGGSSVNENTATRCGGHFCDSMGGGILNVGIVNLNGGSSVNENTADYGGGINNYRGTVNLNGGSFVEDNTAFRGGGIFNSGTVTLNGGSSVNENSADYHAGGIYNRDGGTINLFGSSANPISVSGNKAKNGHGGGIYSDSDEFDHLVTRYVEINNNRAYGNNSSAGRGGGVFVTGAGSATFEYTSIAGNESGTFGAGVFVDQGSVHLNASTISDNTSGHNGGGIYNYYDGSVILVNSTISGNHATGSNRLGGGVANAGRLYATNSTITNNGTGYKAGGVYNFSSADSAELYNTIVAGNYATVTTEVCLFGSCQTIEHETADDYWPGPDTTGRNNLFGTYRGALPAGNLQTTDAMLGPLAENGGSIQTHVLLPGSPAIDAGGDFLSHEIDEDQRGSERRIGQIDIGSVELGWIFDPILPEWNPAPVDWAFKYDFGTDSSAVASGYMQVTADTVYTAGGYGWDADSTRVHVDRGGSDARLRDLVYSPDATFQVALVPGGTYQVTATLGNLLYAHDQMAMFLEGNHVTTIDTDVNEHREISGTVTVGSDGVLDVRFYDQGGANTVVAINSLEIVPVY